MILLTWTWLWRSGDYDYDNNDDNEMTTMMIMVILNVMKLFVICMVDNIHHNGGKCSGVNDNNEDYDDHNDDHLEYHDDSPHLDLALEE